jgi:uncharacterized protein with GYD domain
VSAYFILGKFDRAGVGLLLEHGDARDIADSVAADVDAECVSCWFTTGGFDIVIRLEAADGASALAFAVAFGAVAGMTTETLAATEDFAHVIDRAARRTRATWARAWPSTPTRATPATGRAARRTRGTRGSCRGSAGIPGTRAGRPGTLAAERPLRGRPCVQCRARSAGGRGAAAGSPAGHRELGVLPRRTSSRTRLPSNSRCEMSTVITALPRSTFRNRLARLRASNARRHVDRHPPAWASLAAAGWVRRGWQWEERISREAVGAERWGRTTRGQRTRLDG